MYQKLQDVTLKNGERVELGVMLGPDQSELARQVRMLLGHKGQIWQWQIEQSLGPQFKEAQSRFYLAMRAGRPIANVMSVEAFGAGIFGHVFTLPEERRKGLSDKIIGALMQDFRARGGKALYLGTGFDSPPFHLYARHGFKGLEPGSGSMTWFAQTQETFEKEAFAPANVRHEALSFEHWPALPALSAMRHPARVRILTMDVVGPVSTEGGALPYLQAMNEDAAGSQHRAQVAVSEKSGLPVALACVMPEPLFSKHVAVLDLFCAPGFEAQLPVLAERLKIPAEHTAICYADAFWPARQQALRALRFSKAAVLPRFFRAHEKPQDVELWTR